MCIHVYISAVGDDFEEGSELTIDSTITIEIAGLVDGIPEVTELFLLRLDSSDDAVKFLEETAVAELIDIGMYRTANFTEIQMVTIIHHCP